MIVPDTGRRLSNSGCVPPRFLGQTKATILKPLVARQGVVLPEPEAQIPPAQSISAGCVPPLISWTDKTQHTQAAGCTIEALDGKGGGEFDRTGVVETKHEDLPRVSTVGKDWLEQASDETHQETGVSGMDNADPRSGRTDGNNLTIPANGRPL